MGLHQEFRLTPGGALDADAYREDAKRLRAEWLRSHRSSYRLPRLAALATALTVLFAFGASWTS
ncbi:MAG: hypothetical protein U1E56_00555 [Bauldia sp.]